MLVIFLLVLLIWVVLMGFLAAWTFWFQGYLYTEPVEQLYWRAPAVGSALTVLLIIWIAIDYRAVKNNPDAHFPYGPIQEMAPALTKTETEPFASLVVPGENNTEKEYKLEKVSDARKGHVEYRHNQESIPSSPPKLIVVENGERSVFEPDKDAKGHFIRENGQPLLYRDGKGRVLTEGPMFEKRTGFPFWRFLLGVFLNVSFLGVWFVGMWLVLRYQMWHALGLAVVMVAVMLLFVIAPVMSSTGKVVRPTAVAQTTEQWPRQLRRAQRELRFLRFVGHRRIRVGHEFIHRVAQRSVDQFRILFVHFRNSL